MFSKNEVYDYGAWLAGLKTGDRVKTSSCSHRSCNCEAVKVVNIDEMFGVPTVTVVDGCTMRYYNQQNGRQHGSRKGTYKDGNLIPWFKEDDEAIEAKKQLELDQTEAQELAALIAQRVCNEKRHNFRNHLSQDLNLETLTILHAAVYNWEGFDRG